MGGGVGPGRHRVGRSRTGARARAKEGLELGGVRAGPVQGGRTDLVFGHVARQWTWSRALYYGTRGVQPSQGGSEGGRISPLSTRMLRRALRLSSTCASAVPSPSFPCVDAHAKRESRIIATSHSRFAQPDSGPEPPYARPSPLSYSVYHHPRPFPLTYSASLPSFDIAYESWGTLSHARDNAILLHTGLSASSHAASTPLNPAPGWWEKFIGPGKALDTNHFFVICTNVLGGCYGSTGPSSTDPTTGQRFATHFPVLSIFDMVKAQFSLLDSLGIDRLYATVGSSMGAMQSLATGWLFPDRVHKIVSISGTARSTPGSIAMRHAQRSGPYFSPHPALQLTSVQSSWPTRIGTMASIMTPYLPTPA